MNTENETFDSAENDAFDSEPVPITPTACESPDPALGPEGCSPAPKDMVGRRNGKIARLPKSLRDEVNTWIQDGLPYPDIIERLRVLGHELSPWNLTAWKQGGYQDWLLEQRWVEQLRAQQEVSTDLVRDTDPADLNQAALQLGTLQIFKALRDLEAGGMDKRLGGDPAAFARLLNSLARASRESLMLQKYRAAAAEARAQLKEMKDPHRKLTDDERRAIIAKVDEVLGINLEIPLRPPPNPTPNPPEENHPTAPEDARDHAPGETEPADPGSEQTAALSGATSSGEPAQSPPSEDQPPAPGELIPEQEADLMAQLSF